MKKALVKIALSVSFLVAIGLPDQVRAGCVSLIRGPIVVDMKSCGLINPEKTFDPAISQFSFIYELPAKERLEFLNTYRGLHISGRVVRSKAVRTGLREERGALNNEDIVAFIAPGVSSCSQIANKRLKANVEEVCCEGRGEAPCLLNSAYMLSSLEVIGEKSSSAGNIKQVVAERMKEFSLAQKAFSDRDYKKSLKFLKVIESQGNLDTVSAYMMALAYRKLDRCPNAEPYLDKIYQRFLKNQYWAQNEKFIRAGVLLHARCLSVQQKSGEAAMVLQSMLSDVERFDAEIRQSLSHPDFGWIKTSKDFINYRDSAMKAIKSL